ncbi:MAG: hypothetical protein Q8K72_16205, partial [Acidimicrobiales bacterium]|nr:hypothetical protein [Acidimicrobiales bacterium]
YYVVSDLAGVPDLFRRVRPVLASLGGSGASDLKPHARRLVTAWVLVTVPLLAASLAYLAYHLPVLATGMAGSATSLVAAIGSGKLSTAAVNGVSLLALALPVLGLAITVVRAARRGADPEVTRRIAKAVLTFGAPR